MNLDSVVRIRDIRKAAVNRQGGKTEQWVWNPGL